MTSFSCCARRLRFSTSSKVVQHDTACLSTRSWLPLQAYRSRQSFRRSPQTGQSKSISIDALQGTLSENVNVKNTNTLHRAAIALGSNMGDRVSWIEQALALMNHEGMRVLAVSPLYETKAMYYEDQDSFVNGACYIETRLQPLELLDKLQDIENRLGRVRTIDKGPRTLDLDVILYDDQHILHERLQVPHKLLLEREFVLRPLADIVPEHTLPISFTSQYDRPQSVLTALQQIRDDSAPMYSITLLSPQLPFVTANEPTRNTRLMSILNITPDSFSDGGVHSQNDLDKIRSTVRDHIASGATILDVGGQSTRPKADLLTAKEELKRILPVIEVIRAMPEAAEIAISVDTFYSEVVYEASKYGVDIVNDVSAGMLDSQMLPTVADLGKTIILMHMRGNPHTMMKLTDYRSGVVQGVANELGQRVDAAKAAGIYPWRIILDPGIGFAKTVEQNLELIRQLATLRSNPKFSGLPWLMGVSRKGFIGQLVGVQRAHERVWGTAAAVTASIAGGADIVRVHDVSEMAQLSKMADAIYRRSSES